MRTTSPDQSQTLLQIKEDDKFFSRLLSKESSMANPSLRVYYGVAAGSVPFMWESQPGTPKNPISTTTLPPLTPPPSYLCSSKKKPIKKPSRSNPFGNILPRLTKRKPQMSPRSSSSSSSSSSSWSLSSSYPSSPKISKFHARSRISSPRCSFSSRGDDDDEAVGSPTSTLCFSGHTTGGLRGCYSMGIMKNALLSIVGHGSNQGSDLDEHMLVQPLRQTSEEDYPKQRTNHGGRYDRLSFNWK